MAILGIYTNRENPPFTKDDFKFWMPQFSKYLDTEEGTNYFDKLYNISNKKIFYSIYGTDWELAMSYCIAHYLTLIANQMQAPSGDKLGGIAGGQRRQGILSSASVGDFSTSYDIDKTTLSNNESLFWNQTQYGSALMTLLSTKSVASIMVVTSNPLEKPKNKKPWWY